MNVLKIAQQEAVICSLIEGCSIRSTERMTGVHRDTIMRLLVKIGTGCEKLMDQQMRNLACKRLQMDEIWTFVGKKQRHLTPSDDPKRTGDVWTFVALDADTKIVPTYKVGERTVPVATEFVADLSSRLANRVQLSSDLSRNARTCDGTMTLTLALIYAHLVFIFVLRLAISSDLSFMCARLPSIMLLGIF